MVSIWLNGEKSVDEIAGLAYGREKVVVHNPAVEAVGAAEFVFGTVDALIDAFGGLCAARHQPPAKFFDAWRLDEYGESAVGIYILYAQGSVHVEVEDDVMPLRGYAVDFGA